MTWEEHERERDAKIRTRTIRHAFVAWWGDGPRPKGPNGETLCQMCPQPVRKPHREYCSDECVDRRLIMTNAVYARRRVFERDHGVCQMCQLDTNALMVEFTRAEAIDYRKRRYECSVCDATWLNDDPNACSCYLMNRQSRWRAIECRDARAVVITKITGLRFRADVFDNHESLWQMDHIVPVVEGGGLCDLTNLRTLCLPCHNDATAMLARRRGHARRRERKREQRLLW